MVKPHATNAANHSSAGIFGYNNGSVSMQFRFEAISTPLFKGRLRWHNGSSWSTTTGYWTDTATNWHLFSASFDRANSKIRLYKDSTELSTGWNQSITWGEDGDIWVSARAGAGRTVSGDYGEFLIYSSVDATMRAKMEGYLMHKWGLSANLPSGHTYKSNSPSQIAWSDAQSFTTPINTSAPTLGSQSTANLDTTSADMQVVLTDNGNAATTVVFYWGDNDGGTTASNWDSNITLTNAPEGTNLRASLTGLTSGNTYYFRAWATNTANKGDDWANSTTAFTTVTSAVREETDAIRYSDLEGWWKLDGGLRDSSGNNRNASPAWMPEDLEIWMDADDDNSFSVSTGSISSWSNRAGANYTFNQKEGDPKRISGGPNGNHVVKFNGSSALSTNTSYENQNYTVFAVSRQDGGTNGRLIASRDVNWLFGYHSGTHGDIFHNGWVYNSSSASDTAWHIHVSNQNNADLANAWADFTQVVTNSNAASNTTNQPKKLGFGRGYNNSNPEWSSGEVGELLLFDRVLSESERQLIEGYLANKWNLSIPSSHAFSTWPHGSINTAFSQDSATGTGMSMDTSNGIFVEVPTGGTEDTFDGGSAFSVSMWMKGWPTAAGESIIGKDQFDPAAFGSLKAWLDATNPDYLSKDGTVNPPSNNDAIAKWYDLSGNNHHAVASGTPKWNSSLINSTNLR